MSRQKPDRALGPYQHGAGWRIVIRRDGVSTPGPVYRTREEADRAKAKAEDGLAREQSTAPLLFREALDLYLADQRERGLRESSIEITRRRVETYLGEYMDRVASLSEDKAKSLLKDLTARPSRQGKPYSGAWIRYTLVSLKTWGAFLVETRRWRVNTFAALKFKGKVARGKTKLTLDEARAFAKKAHEMADCGDEGAVMALCALYTGLRAGEIVALTVRALDDQGRRLIVFKSKTDAGVRTITIPTPLRPYLAKLAQGKTANDTLFAAHGSRARYQVYYGARRVCRAAKVPLVCAHSFRGLLADLAVVSGEVLESVAGMLGHSGTKVTRDHYADASAIADRERVQGVNLIAPDRGLEPFPNLSSGAKNRPDTDGEK